MGNGKITLYVDVISPFGYMAYWMLRNSPTFKDVTITYVPIFLGGLHKQCGNTAPLFIKNKDKWIGAERMQWATQFQIPMRAQPTPAFPMSTITPQRVLCAVQIQAPERLTVAIDALYAAIWNPSDGIVSGAPGKGSDGAEGFDTRKADVVAGILAQEGVLGKELAEKVMGAMGDKEVKDRLTANTTLSFEAGAFGIPWFQCENAQGEKQGFWGFDHFGQVVR